MTLDITFILWVSVLLQCVAVYLALRIIPISGHAIAWIIISIAFLLMAARRSLSLLYEQDFLKDSVLRGLSTEGVALLISVLIATGVFMIRKIFEQQKKDEEMIRTLSLAVEQSPGMTVITDIDGKIDYVNPVYCQLTGRTFEDVVGRTADIFDSNITPAETTNDIWKKLEQGKTWEGEIQSRYRGSEIRWERVCITPVKNANGDYANFVAVHEDVTKQREHQEQLEYMALHDDLTNLPNRALFNDRLIQTINTAKRTKEPVAVMLMDLDNFKEINDTMGHQVGDEILKEIGDRLLHVVRGADTVARMGGDEFLLLMPSANPDRQEQFLQRIINAMDEPFEVNDRSFDITASIGYALYPDDGEDPEILLRKADVAMYSVKASHKIYRRYNESLDAGHSWRLELFNSLRTAVEEDQLKLHYQPMISMEAGHVDKVEALIRWDHPEKGILYPDSFIVHVEQTHHINKITQWVIRRAIRDLTSWYHDGLKLGVSINISARDLLDAQLFESIKSELDQTDIPPSLLTVEITESGLMMQTRNTMNNLFKLRDLGVMINIDDFGTGYSSLQHLKRLPVTGLKIDKSFVLNMINDENDAIIVRSTTDLAHNMGLKVVAEGIEDQEVYDLLQILGCEYGQGYLISRPIEEPELRRWLVENEVVKTIHTHAKKQNRGKTL